MSIGTLYAEVILDEPGLVHCGNGDPVTGHVAIRYQPSSKNATTELFGPLKIFVTLQGRAKTKIWISRGQSSRTYRGRAPLLARRMLVYNDSFRAQPKETRTFPFSLTFPDIADVLMVDDFMEDSRFTCQKHQVLPPSFQSSGRSLGQRYEAFVEYSVAVNADMPQLQVDVRSPINYEAPVVQYERPRVPQRAKRRLYDWRGYVSLSNELLLPESDRPTGFKQKTKAFFGATQFPTYAFDWVCLAPKDIYLGLPACFEVQIKPREQECTAVLVPQVWLKYFRIEITGHTLVRAERTIFRCPESEGHQTVLQLEGAITNQSDPFSKGNENTKIINTLALGSANMGTFGSTFSTYNISRSYSVKIKLGFEITDDVRRVEHEYAVMVHAPPDTETVPTAAVAGPSTQPPDAGNTTSDLPQYEELPPYEPGPAGRA
ncbi:hypothetical protein F4777DRAFT_522634 [Nemania sp. FL0916]|nr:hypothetical protein F4777DRAFT_522634 [Nemania sp. FL0916]